MIRSNVIRTLNYNVYNVPVQLLERGLSMVTSETSEVQDLILELAARNMILMKEVLNSMYPC